MGAKDITEKTLEAYNDVFSDIVNGLLFHGKQLVQEDMLTDAQPVSMYKADSGIHEQQASPRSGTRHRCNRFE